MHIQLDPVGGMAGDMFVAAMLDAFPLLEAAVREAVRAAGLPSRFRCDLVPHADHALHGKRFLVIEERPAQDQGHGPAHDHHHPHSHPHLDAHPHSHDHEHAPDHRHSHPHSHPPHPPPQSLLPAGAHEHAPDHEHGHRPFVEIRAGLESSSLHPGVRGHAIAIFSQVAEAEAQVHGATTETVSFHELGEWDSIADIVAAAAIMHALSPATWSVGPLPLGSGFVKSAHGLLPVPAPATTLLLRGLRVREDGVPGERVTPTGAAIARHLSLLPGMPPRERTMLGTGLGFGTRALPGISNCLRALVFDTAAPVAIEASPAMAPSGPDGRVSAVEFEVDDQTPEDLAIGLDHLRGHPDVLDVLQTPAFGKKGRVVISIRVLCRSAAEDDVAAVCFQETTTLGIRFLDVRRHILVRSMSVAEVDGQQVDRKHADRGTHVTTKVEADSLREVKGHAERERLRRAATDG